MGSEKKAVEDDKEEEEENQMINKFGPIIIKHNIIRTVKKSVVTVSLAFNTQSRDRAGESQASRSIGRGQRGLRGA